MFEQAALVGFHMTLIHKYHVVCWRIDVNCRFSLVLVDDVVREFHVFYDLK